MTRVKFESQTAISNMVYFLDEWIKTDFITREKELYKQLYQPNVYIDNNWF